MSSPNFPSEKSFSSSANDQGPERDFLVSSTGSVAAQVEMAPPTISLPSDSSDGGGRNGPFIRRYCENCDSGTMVNPSAAWTANCPLCRQPFQSEPEGQSASSTDADAFSSQPINNLATRSAGFEDWNMIGNFFYIAWDYNSFFHPVCGASSVMYSIPKPSAGDVITLPFLKRFLRECFLSGARITISVDDETAYASLMSEKGAQPRDGHIQSYEITCCICLNSLANGRKVRVTPCNHSIHEICLLPWLILKKTCPICRLMVFDEDFKIETNIYARHYKEMIYLRTSGFHFRTINPDMRKFVVKVLWPHGEAGSQAKASSSGDGQDARHAG